MRCFILLLCALSLMPAQATTNNLLSDLLQPAEQTFLPVDQAFSFDFDQQGNTLFIGWDIAPGYYLYKKKLEIIGKGANIQVPELGKGVVIEDEFFGKTEVFFDSLSVISKLSNVAQDGIVKVRYQGCAEAGLCYPPEIISIPLSVIAGETVAIKNAPDSATAGNALTALGIESPHSPEDAVVQEDDPEKELNFTEKLASQGLLANLAIFFLVGIGLAFTPCVFPMFPILSSLIAGQKNLSTKKAFALSFIYIQGMAVTYAALGLVVASLGGQVQGYLQHPTVLISFSLLFVLLAMSMFGWYEIKLPSGMMNKLTQVSNNQKGGNYIGVFLMGVLSGLIASPCTTAPLSAALLFVAQSGDYLVGGLTLYVLSLGMGIPLLLLGTSGGKLLPKAGGWMEQVKTLFGFIMLVVPLILLERIVDADIILLMAGLLALATALYLHHWQSAQTQGKLKTALWFAATLLVVGGASLTKNYIWPTAQVVSTTNDEQQERGFKLVANLAELKQAIGDANNEGRLVMVDLYAEWCVACKEFEKYTFPDAKVQAEFANFELLKIDLTESDDITIEVMEEFTVFGLPSILFFDMQGEELGAQRVTGFLNANDFAEHLAKVSNNVK
ncbi:thiol:disulfide interchange protein [Pseudoalteromonas porphyrae]|uniref:Thiol:disulfide interchange protein DsbD n=1 Tax=Pseudoalteromonas porphyrae TaxID=187330 RepID=A0A0N1MVG6_9GAMM|nr:MULTISPECIES: protein-disulfide reductase DsbD [Pseudoalteromonas]KPH65232.1 thiol:disulfide interchange protein [Pseudoalteromonas porphyrae]KPH95300.1 thiol:disulfide interchange protein [Pseudoalteromonas porphyrae]NNG44057.1 protein-disulfide reductase DsbD [Pseudoalteromonas sp. NEC-BIFX-2020_002]